MTLYIFIGPTLRREEVSSCCEAICLPPVAQGDVWRIAQNRPRAIGIVDGYFSGIPSVWHKEILWALAEGIQVFGSASMGALRAAELHSFGMRGVGRIFEAFRDGALEDDDEVAVVHGPPELGFPALSEPMVNIRATLDRAAGEGILTPSARDGLSAFAKSLHFPERTWPRLLADGNAKGASREDLGRFSKWLPAGRIDQKREDALAMIRCMQAAVEQGGRPQVSFGFEWTVFWDEMVAGQIVEPGAIGAPGITERVLEELRLEGPDAVERIEAKALARLLAGMEARRLGLSVLEPELVTRRTQLRSSLGLFTRAALDAWLHEHDLDEPQLARLVEAELQREAANGRLRHSLGAAMLDELRLSGAYRRLADRAQQKISLDQAEGSSPQTDRLRLRIWYFEERLGRPMPDDVAAYAKQQGFADLTEFDGALRREHLYFTSKACGERGAGENCDN